MSVRHLDRLLEPRSVALVGASARPGSVGATVWRNLRASVFAGPIFAVNPKHATLDGVPCHGRPEDLPEAPDLAVICTPPATVPALIDAFGRLGTRAAIVMSAGLDPCAKQAMLDAARPHVLRILGPNCIGLLTPRLGLNATFAHTDARAGDMAFVSQSGALVTAVLDWAQARRIGFSTVVSLGERAGVRRRRLDAAAGATGLDDDHRLVARRRARRRHELARRLDRFDVEQDRPRVGVAGEMIEQVAEVDVGALAHRDQRREADPARLGPVEHGGDERT